jgi:hypothetical protein
MLEVKDEPTPCSTNLLVVLHQLNDDIIMFTPARDFLLETPLRIIIPNPNVNSHSL